MKQKKMWDGQTVYEVTPLSHQKSFYGKAWEYPIGGGWELISYCTKVARIVLDEDARFDEDDSKLVRLWGSYSATTMKHINAWLQWHGMKPINKKQWMEMEVVV